MAFGAWRQVPPFFSFNHRHCVKNFVTVYVTNCFINSVQLYPTPLLTLRHPVRNYFTQYVTHLITHSSTINAMHTNSIILCQFIKKNFLTNYFLYTLCYVTHCVTITPTIYVAHSVTHSAANYVTHSVTHYVNSSRIPPLKMSRLVRIKERYRSWQPWRCCF